jgi:hypothetical protein
VLCEPWGGVGQGAGRLGTVDDGDAALSLVVSAMALVVDPR